MERFVFDNGVELTSEQIAAQLTSSQQIQEITSRIDGLLANNTALDQMIAAGRQMIEISESRITEANVGQYLHTALMVVESAKLVVGLLSPQARKVGSAIGDAVAAAALGYGGQTPSDTYLYSKSVSILNDGGSNGSVVAKFEKRQASQRRSLRFTTRTRTSSSSMLTRMQLPRRCATRSMGSSCGNRRRKPTSRRRSISCSN